MPQIVGNKEAIEVIRLIASSVDICRIQYQSELKLLQDTAPIRASFILKLPFSEPIPEEL